MLRKADHIGIMVSDMDRSIAWYTEVLGLKLRQRVRLSERAELAFITLGDTEIELICRQGDFNFAREGVVNHLAFTVDDIAAVLAHLKAHGVTLRDETPRYLEAVQAQIAFFAGPDGETFELVQHAGK